MEIQHTHKSRDMRHGFGLNTRHTEKGRGNLLLSANASYDCVRNWVRCMEKKLLVLTKTRRLWEAAERLHFEEISK